MEPSESLALALIVILAGAVNTALFAGPVTLTVGGALTMTLIGLEGVSAPLLSVALSDGEYRQAPTLVQVKL
jgi:hypothetical protein